MTVNKLVTSLLAEGGVELAEIKRGEVDVVVMGSVELSNTTKGHHLGSVAMALTKATPAHVVVVKQFAHT